MPVPFTPMQLETSRFGILTYDESELWRFPEGMIGLPDCCAFMRFPFDDPDVPFEWLQCVDEPAVAFLVTDPARFFPDYAVELGPDDLAAIELAGVAAGELRCVVTVPEPLAAMTANLLGPLVLNRQRRLGMQLVLSDSRYATKHALFPPADAYAGP